MRYLAILTIVSAIFFLIFPNIDLGISSHFYKPKEGFIYNKHPILVFFYYLIYWLTTALLIFYAIIAISKLLRNKAPFFNRIANILTWPKLVFLTLTLIIGPGIIVHNIIKPSFDRPRPVNVMEFGGKNNYAPPFIDANVEGGKSFVSGHSAMGFYLIAFAFLFKGKKRFLIYAGGFAFGSLIATSRIMQGAHFLSDTIFGALVTIWIIHLLNYLIFGRPQIKRKLEQELHS